LKIFDRQRLDRFCTKHADARRWIEIWLGDVESARWASPHDIRDRYPSASFLGKGIVIFNVKGNAYRLEISVAYTTGIVAIEWAGTHAEYEARNRRR
jgi:mRNA interferase HigB